MHALDLSMLREKPRDLHRVLAMRAHPPRQRAQPAQDQPAIERRGDSAADILDAANPLEKFVVSFAHDHSARDVAMAAEISGGRSEERRGGKERRSRRS